MTDKALEPVAWQVKFRDDAGIPQIAWFPHPVHPDSALAQRPYNEEPLYTESQIKECTAPPKKEWVGLSDREKIFFIRNAPNISTIQLIEAVDEELKAKNA